MSNDILYPLRRLHGRIYDYWAEMQQVPLICKKIEESTPQTVIYAMTPTHGNLGDHAIAKASKKLFEYFSVPYIEVTDAELRLLRRHRKLGIMNHRLILVNGGGNLGTLWYAVEQLFREIIISNPTAKIICLPNTIYYENSDFGRRELEKAKKIYNNHPNLRIYAREKRSYRLMMTMYRDVALTPDMALFLNECKEGTSRHGCLICLRSDNERTRSDVEEAEIYHQARILFGDDIVSTDMVLNHEVPVEQRDTVLDEKFNQFRHVELVITDRLHGMIFSAITGTPCIVINSKSPKVLGCYEWIKNLRYIQFATSVKDIAGIFRNIPNENYIYVNNHLICYYEDLGTYISERMKMKR